MESYISPTRHRGPGELGHRPGGFELAGSPQQAAASPRWGDHSIQSHSGGVSDLMLRLFLASLCLQATWREALWQKPCVASTYGV